MIIDNQYKGKNGIKDVHTHKSSDHKVYQIVDRFIFQIEMMKITYWNEMTDWLK